MKEAKGYKKGQYVVCRFNGRRNGDLLVGKVESVRSNGIVVLENMLTGRHAFKQESVLDVRNVRVGKGVADSVVLTFKSSGLAAARNHAIAAARSNDPVRTDVVKSNGVVKEVVKASPEKPTVANVIAAFRALSAAEQAAVSRVLWGKVLSAFGID